MAFRLERPMLDSDLADTWPSAANAGVAQKATTAASAKRLFISIVSEDFKKGAEPGCDLKNWCSTTSNNPLLEFHSKGHRGDWSITQSFHFIHFPKRALDHVFNTGHRVFERSLPFVNASGWLGFDSL